MRPTPDQIARAITESVREDHSVELEEGTPAPTTRIAAIDHHSGYVWGVTVGDENDLPAAAVAILTESDRTVAWGAAETSRRDIEASLHLYAIADDLPIVDGQDRITIAAVERGRYLGAVRSWDRASADDSPR